MTIDSDSNEFSPDDLRLATLYVALGKAAEILQDSEEATLSGPDILRGLLIESVEVICVLPNELLLEAVTEVKRLVLIEKKEEFESRTSNLIENIPGENNVIPA